MGARGALIRERDSYFKFRLIGGAVIPEMALIRGLLKCMKE